MNRPRVIIVGGGFAGVACANRLSARKFQVTLVDKRAHFEFIPNIHELISDVKKPGQLRLSLKASMEALGHRFLRAEVSAIDAAQKRLVMANRKSIEADYLVVACGSDDADYGVSGVDTHALRFRSVADGQAVRQRLRKLAAAKGPAQVNVVGAGLAGVEVVGELLRRYAESGIQVRLIEAQTRLLPQLAAAIGDYVKDRLEDSGVECLCGDAVARVTAKTIALSSGRRLGSDLTIWTGGPRPLDMLSGSGLAAPRAWVPVDPCLEHHEHGNVFVIGDTAQVTPPIRKQAYHALDMGDRAAKNIDLRARGRPLRPYRPMEKPVLLALGDLDTILIAGDKAVAGPALASGKEAVFAAVMTQLDRRERRDRALAVIERGRQAGRALLWPTLSSYRTLQRQAQVQLIL